MAAENFDDLLSKLKEMEQLLTFPSVPGHLDRANELALAIARATRFGEIANLAMKVISEANALRGTALPLKAATGRLNAALWRLRLALQEAKSRASGQAP